MARQKKRTDGRCQKCFRYNGERYTVYGNTPTEAEEAKIQKLKELEAGVIERENPTLNNYYIRFTEARRDSVKEATLRGQSNQFRKCAAVPIVNGKTFGQLRMRDIKAADLQTVQQAIKAIGNSTRTVNDAMAHINHVFNMAVKDETIDRNPCIAVAKLRRTEVLARDTTHRALTREETALFLETAADMNSYFLPLFKLMLNTGMRLGEVGALTLADIGSRAIHVTKTVTRNEAGGYSIGDSPKTNKSNRDIPLNDAIKSVIKEQRKLNNVLFSKEIKLNDLLFRSPEGKILRDYTVNREIKRITDKCNIEHFTSHALRATFTTRFIEQRPQDYKILSEILGHADVNITLNLYAHTMEENKIIAMKEMNIAY
ncbi:MAG: site-specific integrase [Lachnospiraceae bacterium]|nr:site-specific integrase [Lachnospiraceae bacterium]